MKSLARQRDRDEIRRRLREVRPHSVRRWGRMSAHQMVCHLADAFRMAMGQKPARRIGRFVDRSVLKWFVLYLPIPWPGGIRTNPEIDQDLDGTRPAEFSADVAELETLVTRITSQPRGFDWQPHPLFGSMSDAAWLRWAYLHTDHHLRQFGA
jgi:hypothetical protein